MTLSRRGDKYLYAQTGDRQRPQLLRTNWVCVSCGGEGLGPANPLAAKDKEEEEDEKRVTVELKYSYEAERHAGNVEQE